MRFSAIIIPLFTLVSAIAQAAYVGELTITGIKDSQVYQLSGGSFQAPINVYSGLQLGNIVSTDGTSSSFYGWCLNSDKTTNLNKPYKITSIMPLNEYLNSDPQFLTANPNIQSQVASFLLKYTTENISSSLFQGVLWKLMNPSLSISGSDSFQIPSIINSLTIPGDISLLSNYKVYQTDGAQDYIDETPSHPVPTPSPAWLVIIGGILMVVL